MGSAKDTSKEETLVMVKLRKFIFSAQPWRIKSEQEKSFLPKAIDKSHLNPGSSSPVGPTSDATIKSKLMGYQRNTMA